MTLLLSIESSIHLNRTMYILLEEALNDYRSPAHKFMCWRCELLSCGASIPKAHHAFMPVAKSKVSNFYQDCTAIQAAITGLGNTESNVGECIKRIRTAWRTTAFKSSAVLLTCVVQIPERDDRSGIQLGRGHCHVHITAQMPPSRRI